MDEVLYRAILERRSVRRYDSVSLEVGLLARVRALADTVQPLVQTNTWRVLYTDELAREDLAILLGAYGRLLSAPHALVPHLLDGRDALIDLGYRAEQLAVGLALLGLGSCYVGTLAHEGALRARLNLASGATVGALLLYGREATDWPGRALNRTLRGSVGATNKRPVDKLCYVDSFARAGLPPDELLPLLEAARSAPSASNAQPWRFLWRQGVLHLYVTRRNLRYGLGPTQNYRLYDGGICMANVALALRAMGRAGKWQLHTDAAPMHPDTLEPLAYLVL
ncbi:MAG: hypothetical protein GX557_08185 [Chloroflexi bacterium]|nr:hypothetical protein [Chloroflexota bacterium]